MGPLIMAMPMNPRSPWRWRDRDFELDWSDFRRTEKARTVAIRQVAKLRAEGRDLSVSALKNRRRKLEEA